MTEADCAKKKGGEGKDKTVSFRFNASYLEELHQVVVLAVDITADLKGVVHKRGKKD
jgi:hypothetical protein